MFPFQTNTYAGWRSREAASLSLREREQTPPERLLQAIWFHQRLQRDRLRTLDGAPLAVLHPGYWNREAGPDFRGAMIQFGAAAPVTGDVEIDLRGSDWRGHGHHRNPGFRRVVLHVVWEEEGSPGQPTLALKHVLDSSMPNLAQWLGSESAKSYPVELLGRCCAPLRQLAAEHLHDLLRQAAWIRFQAKAAQLQARARQAGWEQALWEAVFRALGYKQNLWPMQRLGELRARLSPERTRLPAVHLQARLLGVAGLLPDELARKEHDSDGYLRRLWDIWWRERETFEDCLLPRALWKFSGLRPANHPQRRLALAAHWLADGRLASRLERWCQSRGTPANRAAMLLDTLQVARDEFWSRHWTLRSRSFSPPQPLLGATRVTDLAINVILPWLWVRALEGRHDTLMRELQECYFTWPAAEDNAVLRLARQRLLGTTSAKGFAHAASQQGLLQIVKDFCEHSNALCAECRFPDLISDWKPA